MRAKKLITVIAIFALLAAAAACTYNVELPINPSVPELKTLETPVLTYADGVLEWKAVPNAHSYILYGGDATDRMSLIAAPSAEDTSYNIGGLSHKYYTLTAVASAGSGYKNSAMSNYIALIDKLDAPVLTLSEDTLKITWLQVPLADKYLLTITDSDGNVSTKDIEGTVTEYDITSQSGSTATYFMVAKAGEGSEYADSDVSESLSVVLSETLTAPAITFDETPAIYRWEAIPRAIGYEIFVSRGDSMMNCGTINENSITVGDLKSLIIENSLPPAIYSFSIRAVSGSVWQKPSISSNEIKNFIVDSKIESPHISYKDGALIWSGSQNTAGYKVYKRVGGADSVIAELGADILTYDISDLIYDGETAAYYVTATPDNTEFNGVPVYLESDSSNIIEELPPLSLTLNMATAEITFSAIPGVKAYTLVVGESKFNLPAGSFTYNLARTKIDFSESVEVYIEGNSAIPVRSNVLIVQEQQLTVEGVNYDKDNHALLWSEQLDAAGYKIVTADGEISVAKGETGYALPTLLAGATYAYAVVATGSGLYTDSLPQSLEVTALDMPSLRFVNRNLIIETADGVSYSVTADGKLLAADSVDGTLIADIGGLYPDNKTELLINVTVTADMEGNYYRATATASATKLAGTFMSLSAGKLVWNAQKDYKYNVYGITDGGEESVIAENVADAALPLGQDIADKYITFYVKAAGNGAEIIDSDPSNKVTLDKITTPTLTSYVNGDEVFAKWDKVQDPFDDGKILYQLFKVTEDGSYETVEETYSIEYCLTYDFEPGAYTFAVRAIAVTADGTKIEATASDYSRCDITVTVTLAGVNPESAAFDGGNFTLTWGAVENATGYVIDYALTNGDTTKVQVSVDTNSFTFTNAGAITDITITATGDIGFLPSEKVSLAISGSVLVALDAPSDFTYDQSGIFNWSAVENANGYRLIYTAHGATDSVLLSTDKLSLDIRSLALSADTEYTFGVTAVGNAQLYFSDSAVSEIIVLATRSLSAPAVTDTDGVLSVTAQEGCVITWYYGAIGEELDTAVGEGGSLDINGLLDTLPVGVYGFYVRLSHNNPLIYESAESEAVVYTISILETPVFGYTDGTLSWTTDDNSGSVSVWLYSDFDANIKQVVTDGATSLATDEVIAGNYERTYGIFTFKVTSSGSINYGDKCVYRETYERYTHIVRKQLAVPTDISYDPASGSLYWTADADAYQYIINATAAESHNNINIVIKADETFTDNGKVGYVIGGLPTGVYKLTMQAVPKEGDPVFTAGAISDSVELSLQSKLLTPSLNLNAESKDIIIDGKNATAYALYVKHALDGEYELLKIVDANTKNINIADYLSASHTMTVFAVKSLQLQDYAGAALAESELSDTLQSDYSNAVIIRHKNLAAVDLILERIDNADYFSFGGAVEGVHRYELSYADKKNTFIPMPSIKTEIGEYVIPQAGTVEYKVTAIPSGEIITLNNGEYETYIAAEETGKTVSIEYKALNAPVLNSATLGKLSWDKIAGATKYVLYVNGGENKSLNAEEINIGEYFSYITKGKISFAVSAQNDAGVEVNGESYTFYLPSVRTEWAIATSNFDLSGLTAAFNDDTDTVSFNDVGAYSYRVVMGGSEMQLRLTNGVWTVITGELAVGRHTVEITGQVQNDYKLAMVNDGQVIIINSVSKSFEIINTEKIEAPNLEAESADGLKFYVGKPHGATGFKLTISGGGGTHTIKYDFATDTVIITEAELLPIIGDLNKFAFTGEFTLSVICYAAGNEFLIESDSAAFGTTISVKRPSKLDTPDKLDVENGKVTWRQVRDAQYYTVNISGAAVVTENVTINEFRLPEGIAAGASIGIAVTAKTDEHGIGNSDSTSTLTVKLLDVPSIASLIYDAKANSFSWDGVDNANGYVIVIDGKRIETKNPNVNLDKYSAIAVGNVSIAIGACGNVNDGKGYADSYLSEEKAYAKLDAVDASVNENTGVIEWSAVSGAKGYYVIYDGVVLNDGEIVTETDFAPRGLNFKTNNSYAFDIITAAAEDGINSDKIRVMYYTRSVGRSELSVNSNGDIEWTAAANAINYRLIIDGEEILLVGNVTEYSTADLIEAKSYEVTLEPLGNGMNIIGDTNTAALSYTKYKLSDVDAAHIEYSGSVVRWKEVSGVKAYQIALIIRNDDGQEEIITTVTVSDTYRDGVEKIFAFDVETFIPSGTDFYLKITTLAANNQYLNGDGIDTGWFTFEIKGDGSANNPYVIEDENTFMMQKNESSAQKEYFVLGRDIILTSNNPIATFNGKLDGKGFTVTAEGGVLYETLGSEAEITGIKFVTLNGAALCGTNNGKIYDIEVQSNGAVMTANNGLFSSSVIYSELSPSVQEDGKIAVIATTNGDGGVIENVTVQLNIVVSGGNIDLAAMVVTNASGARIVNSDVYGRLQAESSGGSVNLGGIAVINDGEIIGAENNAIIKITSAQGSVKAGGIAAVNGANGVIADSKTYGDAVIYSSGYAQNEGYIPNTLLGGAVAENKGTLTNVGINNNLYAEGGVGGVAAINIGSIEGASVNGDRLTAFSSVGGAVLENTAGASISDAVVKVNIYQLNVEEYAYIGGVIAINGGSAVNLVFDARIHNVSVSGNQTIGGVIGMQSAKATLKNAEMNTRLIAGGNAGGAVGDNAGEVDGVRANAAVSGAVNAGGIAGINTGALFNIQFSGTSESANGNAGGIAGTNDSGAAITNATVANGAKVIGGAVAGGVAGDNKGDILNAVTYADVTDAVAAGGITGKNNGVVAKVIMAGTVNSENTAGAIAAINSGRIAVAVYDSSAVIPAVAENEATDKTDVLPSTAAQMKLEKTYSAFNMSEVWQIRSNAVPNIRESAKINLAAPEMNVTLNNGIINGNISWASVYGATAYQIIVIDPSGRETAVLTTDSTEINLADISSLTIGKQYDIAVRAIGGSDERYIPSDVLKTCSYINFREITDKETIDGKEYYQIDDALELVYAAYNPSNNYILKENIDLLSAEWVGIGRENAPFSGIFEGNDKSISNYRLGGGGVYNGLFGFIGAGATVKNLNVTTAASTEDGDFGDINVSSGSLENVYVGALAGRNDGIIQNVSVKSANNFIAVDIFVDALGGSADIGGIIGYNSGEYEVTADSVTQFDISMNSSYTHRTTVNLGGAVGNNAGVLKNAVAQSATLSMGDNMGTYSASVNMGAVAGTNSGKITGAAAEGLTSSIGNNDANVGGIVGFNCKGVISGAVVDGIEISVFGNGNHAEINAGGIAGETLTGSQASIINSEVRSNSSVRVTGTAKYMSAGGLAGKHRAVRGEITSVLPDGTVVTESLAMADNTVSGGTYAVTSESYGIKSAGGLVGRQEVYAIMANNTADGVDVRGYYAGGAVGVNAKGNVFHTEVINSNVMGQIAGGLVGMNSAGYSVGGAYSGEIKQSYVSGGEVSNLMENDRNAELKLGGLIGCNENGAVNDSYANTTVRVLDVKAANKHVGGLIGINNKGDLSNVYAANRVYADNMIVGGLVGTDKNGKCRQAIFDTEISAIQKAVGTGKLEGAIGRTDKEMRDAALYSKYWDGNIWKISNGNYPTLKNVGARI